MNNTKKVINNPNIPNNNTRYSNLNTKNVKNNQNININTNNNNNNYKNKTLYCTSSSVSATSLINLHSKVDQQQQLRQLKYKHHQNNHHQNNYKSFQINQFLKQQQDTKKKGYQQSMINNKKKQRFYTQQFNTNDNTNDNTQKYHDHNDNINNKILSSLQISSKISKKISQNKNLINHNNHNNIHNLQKQQQQQQQQNQYQYLNINKVTLNQLIQIINQILIQQYQFKQKQISNIFKQIFHSKQAQTNHFQQIIKTAIQLPILKINSLSSLKNNKNIQTSQLLYKSKSINSLKSNNQNKNKNNKHLFQSFGSNFQPESYNQSTNTSKFKKIKENQQQSCQGLSSSKVSKNSKQSTQYYSCAKQSVQFQEQNTSPSLEIYQANKRMQTSISKQKLKQQLIMNKTFQSCKNPDVHYQLLRKITEKNCQIQEKDQTIYDLKQRVEEIQSQKLRYKLNIQKMQGYIDAYQKKVGQLSERISFIQESYDNKSHITNKNSKHTPILTPLQIPSESQEVSYSRGQYRGPITPSQNPNSSHKWKRSPYQSQYDDFYYQQQQNQLHNNNMVMMKKTHQRTFYQNNPSSSSQIFKSNVNQYQRQYQQQKEIPYQNNYMKLHKNKSHANIHSVSQQNTSRHFVDSSFHQPQHQNQKKVQKNRNMKNLQWRQFQDDQNQSDFNQNFNRKQNNNHKNKQYAYTTNYGNSRVYQSNNRYQEIPPQDEYFQNNRNQAKINHSKNPQTLRSPTIKNSQKKFNLGTKNINQLASKLQKLQRRAQIQSSSSMNQNQNINNFQNEGQQYEQQQMQKNNENQYNLPNFPKNNQHHYNQNHFQNQNQFQNSKNRVNKAMANSKTYHNSPCLSPRNYVRHQRQDTFTQPQYHNNSSINSKNMNIQMQKDSNIQSNNYYYQNQNQQKENYKEIPAVYRKKINQLKSQIQQLQVMQELNQLRDNQSTLLDKLKQKDQLIDQLMYMKKRQLQQQRHEKVQNSNSGVGGQRGDRVGNKKRVQIQIKNNQFQDQYQQNYDLDEGTVKQYSDLQLKKQKIKRVRSSKDFNFQ